MRLKNEEDLLNIEFRKMVIKEIIGRENVERKKQMKKRYDIFKDGTKPYVIDLMKKEIGSAFEEAKYRIANISLLRKIIDKKAMVYKDGATRECETEANHELVEYYVDKLNHNSAMKKTNKYLELMKNCIYGVLPYQSPYDGAYYLRNQVYLPYLYDVIEDDTNPEIPRVFIFSNMVVEDSVSRSSTMEEAGLRPNRIKTTNDAIRSGDGIDQTIADSPDDKNDQEFVWWSTKYHFTTDKKGNIIQGEFKGDGTNPIGMLPFCNFAKDQDGNFWALGGEDLVDGTILVNRLLSDLYFVAKLQGQGIFYLVGPRVPDTVKVGPSDAIIMQTKEGDPDTQIGFASSSPPIESHMSMIEQYVALMLSSNNLEPGTIQGNLSATSASSGIQEMIRMSENIDDIEDQREIYRDNEPYIFEVIAKWHNELVDRGVASSEVSALGKFDLEDKVTLKFNQPTRYLSDNEKLDLIQKRKDLGLDSIIDSLMRDNPDLTRETAIEKFKQILQDKLEFNSLVLVNSYQDQMQPNQEEVDNGNVDKRNEDETIDNESE